MLSLIACSALAMQLPTLPDQFDTWITANIVNKNYSIVVHEVFDAQAGVALLSRWASSGEPEQGLIKTLYLFSQAEYFHINETGCHGDKMANLQRGPFAHAARAPTSKELFDFANDGQEELYLGQERVNGVLCDKWRSVQTFGNFTMTLDYFFTAASWSSPESNSTQVPVMLHLTGSRPSRHREGEMHLFDHYYTYGHFRVRPLSADVEAQFYAAGPAAPICTGNISMQPSWGPEGSTHMEHEHEELCVEHCSDQINIGPIHGGTAFGYVVLGGVVALLVMTIGTFCLGRSYGRRFQPMVTQRDVRVEMPGVPGAVPPS